MHISWWFLMILDVWQFDSFSCSEFKPWKKHTCISKWCWDQRRGAQVQSLGLNGPKISWVEWCFCRTREDGQFAVAILKHIIYIYSLSSLFVSTCGVALYVHDEVRAGNSLGYFWSWCLWLWLQSSIAMAALRNTLSLCHVAHQQTRHCKVNGAYIQYEAGRGCKQVIGHVDLIQTSKTLV